MLEVHAILQRQRCNENITKKTGTLSDAYEEKINKFLSGDREIDAYALLSIIKKKLNND